MAQETDKGAFNRRLDEMNTMGLWEVIRQDWNDMEELEPYVWRWENVRPALEDARDVISLEEEPQGSRRNIGLRNPSFDSGNFTSRTLSAGIQIVEPGEVARAHRHNVFAFRFVIEGQADAYTAVDGERFPMKTGDLVLTPPYDWHDHKNEDDEAVVWLDGLDAPLWKWANAEHFEKYEDDYQEQTRRRGYSTDRWSSNRPFGDDQPVRTPPYRYPWEETSERLQRHAADESNRDPYDGYALRYANPATGGPTYETMSLRVQLLDGETETHRHNSVEIYHVFQGSGTTTVGDETLEWEQGDTFVVPGMKPHSHAGESEEPILFVMSDAPVYQAFELYREEAV